MLTIVMYHYVRDLARTRFPEIRGLTTDRFEGQLDYLTKHYSIRRPEEVVAAVRGETVLPPNACLLTFDDGLRDHYATVFPHLEERRIAALFCPAAQPIQEHTVLDVHMIHFVLASVRDHHRLVDDVLSLVDAYRSTTALPDRPTLYRMAAGPSRFDSPDITFVKRLLQRILPPRVRGYICRTLFERYVSADITSFAAELYMDLAELRCLARNGMTIAGHGYGHDCLEFLEPAAQGEEIRQTMSLLEAVNERPPTNWIMCYPYGSYSQHTLDLLQEAGCAVGLTTNVGLVTDLSSPLELPRLDTNDLPCAGDASLSEWTKRGREPVAARVARPG